MKSKMVAGIALIVGIVSIAFLAAPIQAYVNGSGNGDLLQTQERDKLRTQDCDRVHTQHSDRQRANECVTNRNCNCIMSMEQYRNQNRERTRSLGH